MLFIHSARDDYDDLWANSARCGARVALNELEYDLPDQLTHFTLACPADVANR
jgi:hypothetical protein